MGLFAKEYLDAANWARIGFYKTGDAASLTVAMGAVLGYTQGIRSEA